MKAPLAKLTVPSGHGTADLSVRPSSTSYRAALRNHAADQHGRGDHRAVVRHALHLPVEIPGRHVAGRAAAAYRLGTLSTQGQRSPASNPPEIFNHTVKRKQHGQASESSALRKPVKRREVPGIGSSPGVCHRWTRTKYSSPPAQLICIIGALAHAPKHSTSMRWNIPSAVSPRFVHGACQFVVRRHSKGAPYARDDNMRSPAAKERKDD